MSQENVEGRRLARTHALYYAATGIWPLLDIHSFERITGPKVDRWLVKTVGVLVTAIGASLVLAARDDPARAETVALAAGSAVALGTIDAVYVAKRRISPVYLLDALAQAALLVAWIRLRRRTRNLEAAALRE
jgi:energy-converting hydrogenase Eha subunit E